MRAEGLLYVASRIKSPPIVSPELFRKWYDEDHIPNLCRANPKDGLVFALRYPSTSPKADVARGEATADVPHPFLALYKLNDVHWLASDEFDAVPKTSDLLPKEVGHDPFGCFEANLRSYKVVARSPVQPGGSDHPKFVFTSEMRRVPSSDEFAGLTKASAMLPGYRGSILCEIVPGLLEHEQRALASEGLVVTWFDEMSKDFQSGGSWYLRVLGKRMRCFDTGTDQKNWNRWIHITSPQLHLSIIEKHAMKGHWAMPTKLQASQEAPPTWKTSLRAAATECEPRRSLSNNSMPQADETQWDIRVGCREPDRVRSFWGQA
jgi:hypothetical protein